MTISGNRDHERTPFGECASGQRRSFSTPSNDRVRRTLDRLRVAATTPENLMSPILEAVRAYATVGEMCDALRDVWGEYEEVPII